MRNILKGIIHMLAKVDDNLLKSIGSIECKEVENRWKYLGEATMTLKYYLR